MLHSVVVVVVATVVVVLVVEGAVVVVVLVVVVVDDGQCQVSGHGGGVGDVPGGQTPVYEVMMTSYP